MKKSYTHDFNWTRTCEICALDLYSQVSWDRHVSGRKHKTAVERREKHQKVTERSIYIKGFSKQVTEHQLVDAFQRFGEVLSVTIHSDRGRYGFVEFSNSESVQKALAVPVEISGKKLKVAQRLLKSKEKVTRKARSPPPLNDMLNERDEVVHKLLREDTDLGCQAQKLWEFLKMTGEEVDLRNLIVKLLQEVFTECLPGSVVQLFGSASSGLGFSGSDLDINLDCENLAISAPKSVDTCMSEGNCNYQGEGGSVDMRQEFESANEAGRVSLVRRVIADCVSGFSSTVVIPCSRCPLIRFTHTASNLCCDLSINNSISVRNTLLLKKYCSLEPRLPEICACIRYWAKVQNVGNCAGGLSSYALNLLVIASLQRAGKLATLDQMRKEDECHPVMCAEWNCSFPEHLLNKATYAQCDTSTQPELLWGFLDLLSELLRPGFVLILKSASIDSLQHFLSVASETASTNFKAGYLNVQDPFRLDHNITGSVSSDVYGRLFQLVLLQRNQNIQSLDQFFRSPAVIDTRLVRVKPPDCLIIMYSPRFRFKKILHTAQDSCISFYSAWLTEAMSFVDEILLALLFTKNEDECSFCSPDSKISVQKVDGSSEHENSDSMGKSIKRPASFNVEACCKRLKGDSHSSSNKDQSPYVQVIQKENFNEGSDVSKSETPQSTSHPVSIAIEDCAESYENDVCRRPSCTRYQAFHKTWAGRRVARKEWLLHTKNKIQGNQCELERILSEFLMKKSKASNIGFNTDCSSDLQEVDTCQAVSNDGSYQSQQYSEDSREVTSDGARDNSKCCVEYKKPIMDFTLTVEPISSIPGIQVKFDVHYGKKEFKSNLFSNFLVTFINRIYNIESE